MTRKEAIEHLRNLSQANFYPRTIMALDMAIEALQNPSADRPTGKWINREKYQVDEDAYEIAICSECGAEITLEYPYDSFCPNCGAKMGGDTE